MLASELLVGSYNEGRPYNLQSGLVGVCRVPLCYWPYRKVKEEVSLCSFRRILFVPLLHLNSTRQERELLGMSLPNPYPFHTGPLWWGRDGLPNTREFACTGCSTWTIMDDQTVCPWVIAVHHTRSADIRFHGGLGLMQMRYLHGLMSDVIGMVPCSFLSLGVTIRRSTQNYAGIYIHSYYFLLGN